MLLLTARLFAADPSPTPDPAEDESPSDRQEWWVPADKLGSVLHDYPRAVLLTRAQYEKLLTDAGPREAKPPKPPREAALVSAQYTGRVEGKVLTVEGQLLAEVLSGEWARVPLRLGTLALAEVKVDGEGALALPSAPVQPANAKPKARSKGEPAAQLEPPSMQQRAGANPAAPAEDGKTSTLLLRGRGPHKITVRFAAPITTTDAWHGANLTLPLAGATSLVVNFPAHTLAECKQPLQMEALADATKVTIALPLNSGDVDLRWRSSGGGLVALPPSLQSTTGFQVDAETVQARSDLVIRTATGTLPETLDFKLAADARMVEITGSDVAGWSVEGQTVHLKLPPGRGARADFTTVVQRPTGLQTAGAEVLLPLPELIGAGRVEGEFTVVGGPGVAMREPTPTPGTTQLPPAAGTAGKWRFVGPQVAPKIRVERLRPRFYADLDTLVDFQPDAIYLERTVTLHPEEGGVYNLLLTLPAAEEVLEVRAASPPAPVMANAIPGQAPTQLDPDPLWRVEAGKLSLRWLTDPLPNRPRTIRVKTRTEPAGWAAGVGRTAAAPAPGIAPAAAETMLFPVAEMTIEGAEKVSGYLALRASENFRMETEAADMLEPRDGRTTPVTGIYAWFRRGAFDLKVRVTRRPSELLASITGYALPLAGVLDLHAQIAWDFRYSGVRSVQVRVPEGQASEFHFDGPRVAERTLAGDIWTIVFQKELTGRQVLAVTAKIPVTRAADDASRFSATVPVIEPLHTQRGSGTWVVEANTDTEIQLTATGMNELDALLAPPLDNYQPRHRVIGVFTWLGPKYGLSLSGVRHAGAGVLTTVVDSMDLTSVLATTGLVRNEAILHIRTAGAQFFDVTLPDGARLLSLLVDGEPSKPVEGLPGHVRVQLDAKQETTAPTELRVLFENKATPEWKARGQSKLAPLRLPPEVPVLNTTWHTFLPEGYYYSGGKNNLTPARKGLERPLLFAPVALWKLRKAIGAMAVLSSAGISDPRRGLESSLTPDEKELLERLERGVGLAGGGTLDAAGSVIASNRSGQLAISQNAIDALLFGVAGTSAISPSGGALSGVFTEPQFERAQRRESGERAAKEREDPDYYNKTIGPKFRAKVEEVKQLFVEARGFYDTGRYDLAFKRTEQILNVDPYNISARKLQEQINKKKEDYSVSGYNQARSFALWQVTKSWDRPVRRFTDSGTMGGMGGVQTPGKGKLDSEEVVPNTAEAIQRKLNTIVIPRLDLQQMTVAGALSYLRQQAEQLDTTETDPAKKGLNMMLLTDGQPDMPTTIPGLNDPARPQAAAEPIGSRITVGLRNVPLGEALRYVTNLAGMKYSIERDGVTVTPAGMKGFAPPANLPVGGEQAKKVGLLPMRMELPRVGEEMIVQGFGAPEQLEVTYVAEADRSTRNRWIFLLGAACYLLLGGRNPWWRTGWIILLLTAIPLVIYPPTVVFCNLLLGGWITGLLVGRLARRFIFNPRRHPEVAA